MREINLGATDVQYARNVRILEKKAVMWWPKDINELESDSSILPRLMESHDIFIDLLKERYESVDSLFQAIDNSSITPGLFIKHLMILTDFGLEPIKRVNGKFDSIFRTGDTRIIRKIDFLWREEELEYKFSAFPIRGIGPKKLGIEPDQLSDQKALSLAQRDIIVILLFAASATRDEIVELGAFERCSAGALLGEPGRVDRFISQRYLEVSRITGGSTANGLGQAAQAWILQRLALGLGSGYEVSYNGKVQIGGTPHTSDVLVSKSNKHVGIEISFQVTTNSTIERKGNEAESRMNSFHSAGHWVAYVIDGVGNFERKSAITKICNNSDCTVAFSEPEVDVLISFIKEKLA